MARVRESELVAAATEAVSPFLVRFFVCFVYEPFFENVVKFWITLTRFPTGTGCASSADVPVSEKGRKGLIVD